MHCFSIQKYERSQVNCLGHRMLSCSRFLSDYLEIFLAFSRIITQKPLTVLILFSSHFSRSRRTWNLLFRESYISFVWQNETHWPKRDRHTFLGLLCSIVISGQSFSIASETGQSKRMRISNFWTSCFAWPTHRSNFFLLATLKSRAGTVTYIIHLKGRR